MNFAQTIPIKNEFAIRAFRNVKRETSNVKCMVDLTYVSLFTFDVSRI